MKLKGNLSNLILEMMVQMNILVENATNINATNNTVEKMLKETLLKLNARIHFTY